MTYDEVLEKIREGDMVVNTFYRRNYYEVYRGSEKIIHLTYNQFKKLVKDLESPKMEFGGFTKHIYT